VNYIYGLGGRDINTEHIKSVYADLETMVKENKVNNLINYLGVR
jgi:pyruvate ferredoxin oxidoreductase alpha subunit